MQHCFELIPNVLYKQTEILKCWTLSKETIPLREKISSLQIHSKSLCKYWNKPCRNCTLHGLWRLEHSFKGNLLHLKMKLLLQNFRHPAKSSKFAPKLFCHFYNTYYSYGRYTRITYVFSSTSNLWHSSLSLEILETFGGNFWNLSNLLWLSRNLPGGRALVAGLIRKSLCICVGIADSRHLYDVKP